MIGNGYCNDEANTAECNYDGGDCCGSCINSEYCTECICLGEVIGNGIPNARVGDAFCNDETNNLECNYDGGDCCLTSPNTDYCSECTCHHQQTCLAGVHPLSLHGDGYCHDELNNLECTYDGGDCCLSSPNTDYCSDCSCHFLGTCLNGTHSLIGNGICNDVTNIALCSYDGGDCCLSSPNIEYCAECTCFSEDTCSSYSNLIGNGICNDETNVAACMFDGLDCCGFDSDNDGVYYYDYEFEVDDSTCTECSCHGMYLCGSLFLTFIVVHTNFRV